MFKIQNLIAQAMIKKYYKAFTFKTCATISFAWYSYIIEKQKKYPVLDRDVTTLKLYTVNVNNLGIS